MGKFKEEKREEEEEEEGEGITGMKLDNNAFLTAATEATVVLECDVINNNHNNHNRVFTLYLCV